MPSCNAIVRGKASQVLEKTVTVDDIMSIYLAVLAEQLLYVSSNPYALDISCVIYAWGGDKGTTRGC